MSAEKTLLPALPGNGIAKVTKWYVKPGDQVEEGELLAEIETDKATMDFESLFSGYVLYIGAEVGKEIREGYLLIIIGDKGTDISAMLRESVETYALNINSAPSMAGYLAEIKPFAGQEIPRNWHICDGTELKRDEAEELFNAISDSFGGDGYSTFCLPTISPPTAGVNYIICIQNYY